MPNSSGGVYKAHYQPAFIGSYDSEKMRALALEFWQLIWYFKECRKPRERLVMQCDEAYLCHRYVPDTGAIQLIEDSEFGESDIYDAMNLMSIRQTLAVMPRNYPWLTVSSREGEADEVIQGLQDHQIFLHRRARTRRNMQRFLKQKDVRGRSWLYWEWREEVVWRRITDVAENSRQLKAFLKKAGMTKKDAEKMTNGRYPHTIFSGPLIYPLDWWDCWLDPAADMANFRRPTKCIRRFRVKEDLLAERDDFDQDKYDASVVKQLKEYSVPELYGSTDLTSYRGASQRLFGNLPMRYESKLKYVPVYILYVPFYRFNYNGQTETYVDTYFHVAMTDGGPVILYAEENPSDLGHSHIMFDDCIDWFTPYNSGGLGLVEKQLSRYSQKNLLQLLMITGAAHSVIPALMMMEGAVRDDEEFSYLPGALNLVQENPLGLDIVRPVPTAERGVQIGEQLLRFYADDIRAGTGIDGLSTDNAARTISKPKTATEINRDQSSGSLYLDSQAENDAEFVTDLCQAVFEESQKRLIPDREGMLDYERYLGSKVIQSKLKYSDFVVPRSVQVMGLQGFENNQQMITNLLQGLDMATRAMPAFPQAAAFLQTAFIAAWKKLNIPMPAGMSESPSTLQGLMQQQAMLPSPPPPQEMLNAGPQPLPAGQPQGPGQPTDAPGIEGPAGFAA